MAFDLENESCDCHVLLYIRCVKTWKQREVLSADPMTQSCERPKLTGCNMHFHSLISNQARYKTTAYCIDTE